MKLEINELYVHKPSVYSDIDIEIVKLKSLELFYQDRLRCEIVYINKKYSPWCEGQTLYLREFTLCPIKEYPDQIEIFNLIINEKNS
jgi:hypothetical protein